MNTTNKSILFVLISAALIGGSITLGYMMKGDTYQNSNNSDANINSNPTPLITISPDGAYLTVVDIGNASGTQTLNLFKKNGVLAKSLITKTQPETLLQPRWNNEGNRLYFGYANDVQKPQTTLFYIDLNDPDPYAVTEIVYQDSQNLLTSGTLSIAGVDGDKLYIAKEEAIYQIDVDQGINASPVYITSSPI